MRELDIGDLLRQEATRHFAEPAKDSGAVVVATATAERAFMSDTMDQLIGVLQRHR
jgi:hypothetical protein